jgi:hypothetical protein
LDGISENFAKKTSADQRRQAWMQKSKPDLTVNRLSGQLLGFFVPEILSFDQARGTSTTHSTLKCPMRVAGGDLSRIRSSLIPGASGVHTRFVLRRVVDKTALAAGMNAGKVRQLIRCRTV